MLLGGVTGRTSAAPPGAPEATALHRAAGELAERFAAGAEGRPRVTLLVLASAREELRSAAETALASALTQRGLSVSVLPAREAPQAESVALAEGADWLLRVRPVLGAGGRELTLSGEALLTAANFFLQRAQAPRPRPAHLLTATVPADPEVHQLARDPRDLDTRGERRIGIRPLWRIEGRVLALAAGNVGDLGDPAVSLVAVTPEAVLLYSARGELLDRRGTEKVTPGPPVRDPAATVAVGDFGGGRIAYRLAGAAEGEVLAVHFDPGAPRPARLTLVAALPAAPLCAGSAGPLFGAFVPGRSALADRLEPRFDPTGRPRSLREYQVVAAAPRPGRVAYAALGADDALQLLGPALEPLGPPVQGVGAGFALADLDGDGEPALVASSTEPGVQDRVRVLRLAGSAPETTFESPPVSGSILAGAAADLTGDGLDDAILAALVPGTAPGVWVTQLYLVTGDPRGTP
jgi:hypothetical protein